MAINYRMKQEQKKVDKFKVKSLFLVGYFLVLVVIITFSIVEASFKLSHSARSQIVVEQGLKYLKYEDESSDIISDKSDFDSQIYSSGNFELGEEDLLSISGTEDYLTLNTYGDTVIDDSNDWFDDEGFLGNNQDSFSNGIYNDTQWNSIDSWLELDSNGISLGSGEYISEVFDAGIPTSWSSLSWDPTSPYLKELSDNQVVESGYEKNNIGMNSNSLLFHCNDNSLTVSDSSGNSNNGNIIGANYGVEGKFDQGIDFEASEQNYIEVPDSPGLDLGSEATISTWFKVESFDSWDGLLHKGEATDFSDEAYFLQFDGSRHILGGGHDGGGYVYVIGNTTLNTGEWYHGVVSWDSSGLRLYLNGNLEASTTATLVPINSSGSLQIGGQFKTGTDYFFDGVIDEVSIWQRSLTANEIEALYLRGANSLKFQVKSCDDSNCLGENFIGPDGTVNTYYLDNSSNGSPAVLLDNVNDNRYFQYRAVLETTDSNYSPELRQVSVKKGNGYSWNYRKCFQVDNTDVDSLALEEYQIYLDLDTASLVSEGKMKATGSDIRFLDNNGDILDYYIADDMNEDSTRIWLKLNSVPVNDSVDICMYYGNPSANLYSSRDNTFTYSNPQELYYTVNDHASGSTTKFGSYVSDNDITVETYSGNLNEFEMDTFISSTFSQDSEVFTTAPIYGGFADDGTDSLVPQSFAGTSFVYRMDRGTNEFSVYSPWCNADMVLENHLGNTVGSSPYSVNAGQFVNITTDNTNVNGLPNDSTIIIEETGADCPVLITHHTTQKNDSFVMYPASNEWYGVGSGNLEVAALEDGTNVNVYNSDEVQNAYVLNRGESLYVNDTGTQGSDPAHRVVADKPIGVKSIADGDGIESTTFLPPEELNEEYYISQDVQYIAVSTLSGVSTTVQLWEDGTSCGVGTPDESYTVTPSNPYPGKIYFGDTNEGLEYDAGACIVADNPVFAYYESENTDDETNLWGLKQNRQFVGPYPEDILGASENGSWRMGLSPPSRWRSRIPIDIVNDSNQDLTDFQIRVNFDNYSDIFANSQLDGGDLRVAGSVGDGSDNFVYWLENYDQANEEGDIWVKIQSLPANSSTTVYLYYEFQGDLRVTTGDKNSIFTYQNPQSVYFVVDSLASLSSLDLISFEDSNELIIDGTSRILNKGEVSSLPIRVMEESSFTVTGPISASYTNDTTESPVPLTYAGKEFAYSVGRNSDRFSIYAPFGNANIEIYESSLTGWNLLKSISLASKDFVIEDLDITNDRAFKVISDEDVLVFHSNGSADSKILYPSRLGWEKDSGKYELYGVGSASVRLVATEDNTQVVIYRSDGTSSNITLGISNNFTYTEGGGGGQGAALAYHIVADKPIGATSYADGDGLETVSFLSQKEFSDIYLIPEDTQYVSIATKDPDVICRVYDESGVEVTSGSMSHVPPQTSGSLSLPYPNNILIGGSDVGDSAFFYAGYTMICDKPVYAYYEKHLGGNISDETSLLSYPQGRKYAGYDLVVEDINLVDEEGLYYESGSGFSSYIETVYDLSGVENGEHVFWDNLRWTEEVNSRSGKFSTDQVQMLFAYSDGDNCSTATYSSWEELSYENLNSVVDDGLSWVTYTTDENKINFPDKYSDHNCLKSRIYLRTDDVAYAPKLKDLSLYYYIPIELEGQLDNPVINVIENLESEDKRVRILKIVTENVGLINSTGSLRYQGSINSSDFNNADFEFLELFDDSLTPLFDFPPFPVVPPDVEGANYVTVDKDHELALYFNHSKQTSTASSIDLGFYLDIMSSGNGPLSTREFTVLID